MRDIQTLIDLGIKKRKRVYLRFSDVKSREHFVAQCEKEHITLGNDTPVTIEHCNDILALHNNRTVGHVG